MAEDYKKRQIRLYKYLSPKALASFVLNHSLKLSFGYETNDRFELLPGNMLPTNDVATREKESPEMALHGFISLTRVEDNPYMWGYYADMYRGACLEFLFDVEEEKDGETEKVRYRRLDKESQEPSQLRNITETKFDGNYIDICEYEVNRIDRVHKDLPAYARNLITNKHVTWSQEQECRILYSTILRNGKENSSVKGVNTGEGIIYTTADINNCAVALKVAPLCTMQVADIRRGLNSDPVLRGIRVQRAKFEECTYAVRFPEIKDKYEVGLPGDLKEELRKKGVYPMNGLGRNSFLSACRYGDKQLLQNVYENADGKVALMDEDKNHYNGAAIALLRRSVACLDYLKGKRLKPAGLHGENLKNTFLWCASSGAESADYWLEILLDLAKADKEEWTIWTDKYGRNPLSVAARNGRFGCVDVLLSACESQEKKSLLDAQDSEGRTPLMLAAWAKNKEVVNRLLQEKPDLKIQDRDGASALIFAAAASSRKTCTNPDRESRNIVELLFCCDEEWLQTDNQSLRDFITESHTGRTALMYAVHAGYEDTEDCLKQRAKKLNLPLIDMKDNNGDNAEAYARQHVFRANTRAGLEAWKKWEELIKYCKDNDRLDEVLPRISLSASRHNSKITLERIWTALDEMNDEQNKVFKNPDKGGCTPLMWSVYNPETDCGALEFLLKKLDVADLKAHDEAGCNVLMWAARKGHAGAIARILDSIRGKGENLSDYLLCKDENGMTALMWAAWKRRHEAVATIMREAGKCQCQKELLTQRDETGNTALDYAYKADSGEVPENTEGETKREQAKRKTVEELCKWLSSVEESEKE